MIDPRIKQIKIGLVSCGIAAGGEAVYKELTAAAGDIPVVKVGCLGHCYAEPLVEAVLNDGSSIFYNNVAGTADAVANIFSLGLDITNSSTYNDRSLWIAYFSITQ